MYIRREETSYISILILFLYNLISNIVDEDEILVVAIDFGTTYSGFAYSRRRYSEIKIKKWESRTVESMKTPTALLLNQQNSFIAFGYDAEKMYKESVEDEKHKKYRFFKNFKMELHDQKV